MTTVIFVHGTGVRAPAYARELERLRSALAVVRPDVVVEPCDWGSALGAYLHADGVSIPGYRPTSPGAPPGCEEDHERARWALLYTDPYAELALLAMTARPRPVFVPGATPPGERFAARVAQLPDAADVRVAWADGFAGPESGAVVFGGSVDGLPGSSVSGGGVEGVGGGGRVSGVVGLGGSVDELPGSSVSGGGAEVVGDGGRQSGAVVFGGVVDALPGSSGSGGVEGVGGGGRVSGVVGLGGSADELPGSSVTGGGAEVVGDGGPGSEAVGLGVAVDELLGSVVFRGVADGLAVEGMGGPARLVGRALAAWGAARTPGGPGAVPVAARDAFVDAVVDHLVAGDERGIGDAVGAVLGFTARAAQRAGGSRWVVNHRSALSERALGFTGDILAYLVRGAAVRALIADRVRAATGPVVLLGHSLGGVAAFDLLAGGVNGPTGREPPFGREPSAGPCGFEPSGVDLLVTVGSQVPVLYELDALPSRPYGTGLPTEFPPWINIHDPRDLLSFVGEQIFAGRVRDVEVDNGQPVSQAHSAYWANPKVHQVLAREIPR
ncbi:hypothetical protein [Streptomyces sp. SID3343]|uniref:hypothetical protein n=1 Tax=Streptomyces sp. SID3343 TaxID=2690260 RepID=UPI00136CFDD3|nr:hypothetical protein [Streptomyces sp. SID3343]MYV99883.1 hypothetical protein [Streptomyces sp. SID3343]